MHYNTVYAVETGNSLVLVDTGPDYRGAWDELRALLGARLPDLVIATHAHNDHASLGAAWQEAGVPVLLGKEDGPAAAAPGLHQPGELEAMERFAGQSGAPAEVVAEMVQGLLRRHAANASVATDGPHSLPGGRWPTALRFRPFAAERHESESLPDGIEIVRCPGHTPGNLVVVARNEGWLFSGDQLLPDLTATPGIQFLPGNGSPGRWRFRSLPAFLDSLKQLSGRGFSVCYPGHGQSFTDVEAAIQRNIATIEARTAKVGAVLARDQPRTPWDVCESLYRLAARRRPWQLLATVQGHLDVLEERGLAAPTEGGWVST
jgi:glyoxylase-like metal-dependent hydrolase (beta-lactamase superfamily II)